MAQELDLGLGVLMYIWKDLRCRGDENGSSIQVKQNCQKASGNVTGVEAVEITPSWPSKKKMMGRSKLFRVSKRPVADTSELS